MSASGSVVIPCSASVARPSPGAAIFARFRPVALETNGTVRQARGLTSRT